jgi:hypothetical protein
VNKYELHRSLNTTRRHRKEMKNVTVGGKKWQKSE